MPEWPGALHLTALRRDFTAAGEVGVVSGGVPSRRRMSMEAIGMRLGILVLYQLSVSLSGSDRISRLDRKDGGWRCECWPKNF